MDCKKAADFVKKEWNENVIPSLMDFVRIPNVSPSFDAEWDTNGLQLQAFELVTKWAKAQNLENCKIELFKDDDPYARYFKYEDLFFSTNADRKNNKWCVPNPNPDLVPNLAS